MGFESKYSKDAVDLSIAAYTDGSTNVSLRLPAGWSTVGPTELISYNPSLGYQNFTSESYFTTNWLLNQGLLGSGSAYVAYSKATDTAALVFTGTRNIAGALSDIAGGLLDWSGQLQGYRKIVDAFNNYVSANNITNVLATGHSLGGALAEQYLTENSPVANSFGITFGSPGVQQYAPNLAYNLIRYGNTGDFVFDLTLGEASNGKRVRIDRPDLEDEGLWPLPGTTEHPSAEYKAGVMALTSSAFYAEYQKYPSLYDITYDATGGTISPPTNNRIFALGSNNSDTISGGSYIDILDGRGGSDQIFGFNGSDFLAGGDGRDKLYGGAGNDDLRGEDGVDYLYGGAGRDTLYGGYKNDFLYGGTEGDYLKGEAGNDNLYGQGGNDDLFGDGGNDTLNGGEGNDILDGGSGNDTAFYALSFAGNYNVTLNANGTYTVRSLTSAEGTDTLDRVEYINFGNEVRAINDWLTVVGPTPSPPSPTAPTPTVPPSSGATIPDGISSSLLSVTAVNKTLTVGQSIALADLFPQAQWVDGDGAYDINWFAVQDRSAGGGYLTYNGSAVSANQISEYGVADLANWRFVAGTTASTDEIGFNITQLNGNYSQTLTPGAIVTTVEPVVAPIAPIPVPDPRLEISYLDLDVGQFGSSVLENDQMEFTIQRSGNQSNNIVVEWRVFGVGDYPTQGNDFNLTSNTITLQNGAGDATFNIFFNRDNVDEPNETFRIDLNVVSGNARFIDDSAVGTIVDDDAPLGIDPTVDDHGNSYLTATNSPEDLWARGFIETVGDQDWFRFDLRGGVVYDIILIPEDQLWPINGDPNAIFPKLPNPLGTLYDQNLQQISVLPQNGGLQSYKYQFETTTDSTYYLKVNNSGNTDVGQYFVKADVRVEADDLAGDTTTTGNITLGDPFYGHHERALDDDWMRVDLTAGDTYSFSVFDTHRLDVDRPGGSNGFYYYSWDNPTFTIRDDLGSIVAERTDPNPASQNHIEFSPLVSGTYFVSVNAAGRPIYRYAVIADKVESQPATEALVIQGADVTTDIRFPSTRNTTAVAVNDELITANSDTSSAIKFNLTDLPQIATYAAIEIYIYDNASATSFATGELVVGDIIVDVPANAWDQTSTFSSLGNIRFLDAIMPPTVGSWVTIPLTDLYNSWQSGDAPNNGIVLSNSKISNPLLSFYSSDYTGDPSLQPKLVIYGPEVDSTVSGDFVVSVDEDTQQIAGAISIASPSDAAATFSGAVGVGIYGSATVNSIGDSWTYILNANAQALGLGETATDLITLTSSNGVSKKIQVDILGADDPFSVIGKIEHTMNVSDQNVSGSLLLADIDQNDSPMFVAGSVTGAAGTLVISSAGTWTYTLKSTLSDVVSFGETFVDTIKAPVSSGGVATLFFGVTGDQTTDPAIVNLGTSAIDSISGGSGADTLSGGAGNDTIYGNSGADNIDGGAGADLVNAGAGADHIIDPLGNDQINAGAGHDQIVMYSGTNTARGGFGNDLMIGGIQGDQLYGDSGNDVLRGDVGNFGGADIINGGTGDDIMMGGIGADVFVFAANDGTDIIASFNAADVAFDANTGYSVNPIGADFEVGIDHIQLTGFSTVNAANVMSFVTGEVFNAEGTGITFYGIDPASLTANDFIFV